MQEEYQNIYKTARRAAGLTQERAAELLGICPESIRAYETGRTIPSSHVVERMVDRYNAQHLAYEYLKETNSLMGRVVPALEARSVLEVAVRIHNRIRAFSEHHSVERLMAIAEDNMIDGEEMPDFLAIVAELREIIKSCLELEVYHVEVGERS